MKAIKRFFLVLIIMFLIVFPKGGFKVSDIPITWGYLLIFFSVPFAIFNLIGKNRLLYFESVRRKSLLWCMPFILYSFFILLFSNYGSLGYLFSFILSLLVMPIVMLLIFNGIIDHQNFRIFFNKYFLLGIRIVSVFGMFLFIQRIFTGKMLEIPYLTVNIDDFGLIEEKHNLRGELMKFTSTYNNGNIFGICMLIFMPLYLQIENKKIFKVLFLIALIFTLSRTVWLGMVLYLVLFISRNLKTLRGWSILIVSILCIVLLTPVILNLMGQDISFLFDKDLGGRSQQLNVFNDLTLFGNGTFGGIAEIVYVSILQQFGLVGLFFFLIYMLNPVFLYLININKYDKADTAFWGLIIYPFICFSDGAILLIPTAAFFWFLASYSLRPTNKINL